MLSRKQSDRPSSRQSSPNMPTSIDEKQEKTLEFVDCYLMPHVVKTCGIKAILKDLGSSRQERYVNADSQEEALLEAARTWNNGAIAKNAMSPREASSYFGIPLKNSRASDVNAFCGDMLILDRSLSKASIGIDFKLASATAKPWEYGPISIGSIVHMVRGNPSIDSRLMPDVKVFVCITNKGKFLTVDPQRALDALLKGETSLLKSHNRNETHLSSSELAEIRSYAGRISVKCKGQLLSDIAPEDFIASWDLEKIAWKRKQPSSI